MNSLIKKIKKFLTFITFLVLFISSYSYVESQSQNIGLKLPSPDINTIRVPLPDLLLRITNILLYLIGTVALVVLIWGGLQYITSGGDEKKIEKAKNTLTYAIIGLIVAIVAYVVVKFILGEVFGAPNMTNSSI